MLSPSPRRAERRGERSAAPGGASAAGVARPSLHATITKIMSESVKLKEAAARFNRLRAQLPTAAADRALCAALLADIKAQIVEDLGEDLDEDLGEAAAACGHAQQSVLAQMMSQIADDLGEATAYGHAQQPDALRAARGPAQARPSQRRAVLAPISEESFGTSRCAGQHWHEVKKPWKARNTARAHSAGAAAPTVAPGRADTTLTLEQENAVLREELRWAHEDLATFEEVAQVCHPSPRDARAPWCASCKAHPIGRNPDTESAADRRWREIGGRRWSAVSFFVLCCVASARASGQLRGTGTRRRVLLCREAGAGM